MLISRATRVFPKRADSQAPPPAFGRSRSRAFLGVGRSGKPGTLHSGPTSGRGGPSPSRVFHGSPVPTNLSPCSSARHPGLSVSEPRSPGFIVYPAPHLPAPRSARACCVRSFGSPLPYLCVSKSHSAVAPTTAAAAGNIPSPAPSCVRSSPARCGGLSAQRLTAWKPTRGQGTSSGELVAEFRS